MDLPNTPLYRKAFERYLRTGVLPETSIRLWQKAQLRITARYVWMTAGDEKVRPTHAANDGHIFRWDDPPPTGNPGEEPGCRCVAVPYADARDAAEVMIGGVLVVTPANRARVLASRALREGYRRAVQREEVPAKPDEPPPLPRPEGVPKNWEKSISNNGKGIRYRDPNNKHNEVRVQKGNPNSSFPGQRRDYVTWKKGGQSLDKHGNPVPRKSLESHIPIDEFKFDPKVFK